jgi:hypothetical protein
MPLVVGANSAARRHSLYFRQTLLQTRRRQLERAAFLKLA